MQVMEIKRIGEALGAEILGVDLLDPKDFEIDAIQNALLEHEVVFFRATGLDDDSQMALAARFGSLSVFPMNEVMGQTEPTLQVITDGPDSKPGADYWHVDVTWIEKPPRAAFLRATVVPETGGDTMWGSMTSAYDALSAKMKAFLGELLVHHDNSSFIEGMKEKLGEGNVGTLAERLRTRYPGVDHPLIRKHPDNGRRAILWGGHFMRHIVGLEPDESRTILDFLSRHIDQPRFHVRWRWALGDLAIWDEQTTVHRGLGDHYPQQREVRRCIIDGDRPCG
jgi:taurine dioxygenase